MVFGVAIRGLVGVLSDKTAKEAPPEGPEGVPWKDYQRMGSLEEVLAAPFHLKFQALARPPHYVSERAQTYFTELRHLGNVLARTMEAETPTEMRVGIIRLVQHTLNGHSDGHLDKETAINVLHVAANFLAQYFTQTIDHEGLMEELRQLSARNFSEVPLKDVEYGLLGTPHLVANGIANAIAYFGNKPVPDAIVGCANSGTEFALMLGRFLGVPVLVKKTTRRERDDIVMNGRIINGGKECTDGIEIEIPFGGEPPRLDGNTVLVADTQVATGETMAFALDLAYRRGARDAYGAAVFNRIPRGDKVARLDAAIPIYRLSGEVAGKPRKP